MLCNIKPAPFTNPIPVHNHISAEVAVWVQTPGPPPPPLIRACFPKQALVFTCLRYKSFENTAGKGEIARNDQCFLPVTKLFCHFHQF